MKCFSYTEQLESFASNSFINIYTSTTMLQPSYMVLTRALLRKRPEMYYVLSYRHGLRAESGLYGSYLEGIPDSPLLLEALTRSTNQMRVPFEEFQSSSRQNVGANGRCTSERLVANIGCRKCIAASSGQVTSLAVVVP